MTRDELLAILRNDADDDFEEAHIAADKALLEYLNDSEITDAFNSVPRWYS